MRLVVDANVLFAALIKDGMTAELFFDERLELHAPPHLEEELRRNEAAIRGKTTREDIDNAIVAAMGRIILHTNREHAGTWDEALEKCPDPKDTPYFALALALGCPFWTAERGLERQEVVRVVRTSDLRRLFGKAT